MWVRQTSWELNSLCGYVDQLCRIVYVESVFWAIEHMQVRTKTFHKIVYSIVKGLGNFMICNVLS